MTKLNEIKQTCIKANTDIIKLQFGCYFLWKEGMKDKEKYLAVFETWSSKSDRIIRCLMHLGQQGLVEESHIVEIIGRNIHLTDILYVVEGNWKITIRHATNEKLDEQLTYVLLNKWNLQNDNLDKQSEECITFIHQIVYNN